MIRLFQCRLHELYLCTASCQWLSVLHLDWPHFRLDALIPDPTIRDHVQCSLHD